jgi:dihydropteroate synthase
MTMEKAVEREAGGQGNCSLLAPMLKKPFVIMGIVNVTPDSFFDGGKYFSVSRAVDRACQLADQGADILDIGGQSTRPGAEDLDWEKESERIAPVIEAVSKAVKAPISVDTYHAQTAASALQAGAGMINDVSAGRLDPAMADFAANRGVPVILMHSRENPATMQSNPFYSDVVAEVTSELLQSVRRFLDAGVKSENIIIDPGIGFAKRFEDNIALLTGMDGLIATSYPVCVGVSRKSFIGRVSGKGPQSRLFGSLASIVPAFKAGAKIFRVHDVEETVQFLSMLHVLYE